MEKNWLKLDWDNISKTVMKYRAFIVFKEMDILPIVYETNHGFHVEVGLFHNSKYSRISDADLFALRRKFWDDPLRIDLDFKRKARGEPFDVLFHEKNGFNRRKMAFKEVFK